MNAQGSSRTVLFDVGGVLVDAHPDPHGIAELLRMAMEISGARSGQCFMSARRAENLRIAISCWPRMASQ